MSGRNTPISLHECQRRAIEHVEMTGGTPEPIRFKLKGDRRSAVLRGTVLTVKEPGWTTNMHLEGLDL